MSTEDFWKGEFGDEYTKRNRVDWQRRVPFWKNIIKTTGARSVLEFGCGSGWNLSAIHREFPDVLCTGVEINEVATEELMMLDFAAVFEQIDYLEQNDLVFTAGVLIHTAPENLEETMTNIVNKSRHHVLAIEYYSPAEKEIEYRGEKGKLWSRPYGDMYQTLFPNLELVTQGYLERKEGFDNCDWWLFWK